MSCNINRDFNQVHGHPSESHSFIMCSYYCTLIFGGWLLFYKELIAIIIGLGTSFNHKKRKKIINFLWNNNNNINIIIVEVNHNNNNYNSNNTKLKKVQHKI